MQPLASATSLLRRVKSIKRSVSNRWDNEVKQLHSKSNAGEGRKMSHAVDWFLWLLCNDEYS